MQHSHGEAISMDGPGCWRDNVFVERPWRSIKYEEVYLHACESVSAAKAGVGRYIEFYNGRRPHTALGDRTPDEAYFTQEAKQFAAGMRSGMLLATCHRTPTTAGNSLEKRGILS